MAQIVIADIECYDPSLPGTRTLRYATQGYVTPAPRTNMVRYSNDFSNATFWIKTSGGTGIAPVVTPNAGVAPDGTTTADLVVFNKGAGATATDQSFLQSVLDTVIGGQYTASIWVKSATASSYAMRLDFNGQGSTSGGYPSLITVTPEWQRFEIRLASAVDTLRRLTLRLRGTLGTDNTADVYVWEAQQEANPGMTANIHTEGTAVTTPAAGQENLYYEGRIQQPANVRRVCFADGRTFGKTQIGYGDMVLVNNDGALDGLLEYSFAGRAITIKLGAVTPNSGGVPTWTTILSGVMEQAQLSWQKITIRVRDRQQDLAKPLQQTRYGGTNSLPNGLDGVPGDIQGRPKPLVFGQVFNVPMPCVNTTRFIYQLHHGSALQSVDAVYDRGAPLTAGAAYSSQADMETNAPTAGQYRVWNSAAGTYIRLAANPTGTVTADATQGATAANRTAGKLFNAILTAAGISGGSISSADITALDALVSYPIGVFAGHSTDVTPLQLLDEVCASVGAWFGADVNGVFRIGRIVVPVGTSVGTITATEITKIERVASRNPGIGIPAWKIKLGYQCIYNVQNDLTASVTAQRKSFLESKYRRVEASDSAVLTANITSPELEFNTNLVLAADATAEAARLLAIYKVRRDVYEVTVRVDSALASIIDLGKIITLQINRYGMSAGKKFLIVGIRTDMRGYMFELTLWG